MKNYLGVLCSLILAARLVSGQAASAAQPPLMPWPANISVQPGSIPIDDHFTVSLAGAGAKDARVLEAAQRTFARLERQTGIPILPKMAAAGSGTLNIVVEQADHKAPQVLGDDERYSLEAAAGRIRIAADRPLGALRGIETFLQLVQQNTAATGEPGFSVAGVTVHDQPRFEWRGLSLDVSRHFIPVGGIKRTIDGLAAVKLNVLHWHLSDDQGFRIESKKYPRLQLNGSDGLYYTQAEVRDVIAYARDRGVRIVPEFDMPGHATSWLPGYPKLASGAGPYEIVRTHGILTAVLDPAQENTYRFLDGFVGEMAKLFPDEYFHIGGDEVDPKEWDSSARIRAFMKKHNLADAKALQTYFNQRVLKIVTKHGKRMEGWDEVLQPNLPKSVSIQSWRGQESLWQAAKEGYAGILSAGYYLDLMQPAAQHYAIDPMKLPEERIKKLQEEGKPIPAEPSAQEQRNILGGEAAMWEELATAENLDAKLWPRLAAIAERFWSPESVTDVNEMYARLDATNRWLEWLGLTQRSNLELMRQRLAGALPVAPLDRFASLLEPVKGYARHAEKYSSWTPFNRLVDAIAPESDAARKFRGEVDSYLAAPAGESQRLALSKELAEWQGAVEQVRPMLQSQTILTENMAAADTLEALCKAGQDALRYLGAANNPTGVKPTENWKDQTTAAITEALKRQGDLVLPIAPGVAKLVQAVTPAQ